MNKEDYQLALDTLFDNIDLYDEDDINRCINAKKTLQQLINEHFEMVDRLNDSIQMLEEEKDRALKDAEEKREDIKNAYGVSHCYASKVVDSVVLYQFHYMWYDRYKAVANMLRREVFKENEE